MLEIVGGDAAQGFKAKFRSFVQARQLPADILGKLGAGGISQDIVGPLKKHIPEYAAGEIGSMHHAVAHYAVAQSYFRDTGEHEDRAILMKGAAKCVLQMDARPLPIKLQQLFDAFPEAATVLLDKEIKS